MKTQGYTMTFTSKDCGESFNVVLETAMRSMIESQNTREQITIMCKNGYNVKIQFYEKDYLKYQTFDKKGNKMDEFEGINKGMLNVMLFHNIMNNKGLKYIEYICS